MSRHDRRKAVAQEKAVARERQRNAKYRNRKWFDAEVAKAIAPFSLSVIKEIPEKPECIGVVVHDEAGFRAVTVRHYGALKDSDPKRFAAEILEALSQQKVS